MRRQLTRLLKQHVGPFILRRQPRRSDLSLSTWGLSIGANGSLWAGAVDLLAVADDHATPVHLVRAALLDEAATSALAPHRAGDGADIFYSYKTNPVPAMLRRLHERGIGAEVISPFELWLAIELGVPGQRIIYNGPAKSSESILQAIEHDVFLVNANSASEASLIARLAAERNRVVNLGIRIALPGMWGGQFGIDAGSPHVDAAVRQALADSFVALRGLHFHRGLTIRDDATMRAFVADVLAFCDGLRARTGWHPAVLDLGGSLACPTVETIPTRQFRLNRALGADLLAPDPAATMTIAEASALAARATAEHFTALGLAVPSVVLEPGRALTSSAQLLLARVVDVKDDGPLIHAVLDAGINVAEPVRGEFHQLFSVSAPGAPATTPYRLAGPICTPADVLYNNWRLPELAPGHVLAVMDTGAYFVPFSTTFSFPKPAILLEEEGNVAVCRQAETFADVVALDESLHPFPRASE